MAKRQFSFFATYPLSFFSRAMYRDLARNGRGIALGYLALLVAVLTALSWSGMWTETVAELDRQTDAITAQIPDLHFTDGRLHTPEARPYEIRTGETIHAVIDTTGRYGPGDTRDVPIVVTATEFISAGGTTPLADVFAGKETITDRKSTRLNSSHGYM